ncbi:DUF932 domain-containing protein [Erwinia tasmaniensis]|uniref:DUF945 domain-containing protein n=1 Tax=Erwinia tasmaniensis (strain DSM 17950 / CFBP 7177 / CIP 109463 / NCPPB 4357 / Et1/99) TaxID=465817 RepID=B2VB23_ERWT9|nr:DUF932 domain-containing protein [Erwinia tasmaniensis]CAO94945.1 Conserved hypothetical protein [Erwinia tasmaniensis Et1/99]
MNYSRLATKFASGNSLRSDVPLTDSQIMRVAPSIFAESEHESRSEQYTFIPTNLILDKLRQEGFQPFMVCQTRSRIEGMRDFTKHMIRLRHANQITGKQANEIILINSHNGASSYQMKAGVFRFVCQNGLVVGEDIADIRVKHKGDITGNVIEGAYEVLDTFDRVDESREAMQAVALSDEARHAFASAALTLRWDENKPAPVSPTQILRANRTEDVSNDMWTTLNCVQENLIRGGLRGRDAKGKRTTTRAVTGMDQDVKLNRALWVLSEEMRKIIA